MKKRVKQKQKYLVKESIAVKETKFNKRFWNVYAYDLIKTGLIFLLTVLFLYIGISKINSYNIQDLTSIEALMPFIVPIILLTSSFFILQFLLSGFFRAVIWKKVLKQKMSFKFYLKFLLLNIIIYSVFSILFLITMPLQLTTPIIAIITYILLILGVLFFTHISGISTIYLAQSNKIIPSIKQALKTGTKKINLFVLAYIIMFIIYFISSILAKIVERTIGPKSTPDFQNLEIILTQTIPYIKASLPYLIISAIITIFFITYIRIFYAELVKRV